jgi:toxin ParE1/3/4
MPERKARIIWSPQALDDIDLLWAYYAGTAGRATADKILRQVGEIVATIEEFPLAGRPRDEIRAGLRSLVAGLQVVFYRLNNERP